MSASLPDSAPEPAPTAAPSNGLRNKSPISEPQKAPLTAPVAVRFTAWCNCTLPFVVAGHDDRVLHFDQILGLHLGQRPAHLEGVGWRCRIQSRQGCSSGSSAQLSTAAASATASVPQRTVSLSCRLPRRHRGCRLSCLVRPLFFLLLMLLCVLLQVLFLVLLAALVSHRCSLHNQPRPPYGRVRAITAIPRLDQQTSLALRPEPRGLLGAKGGFVRRADLVASPSASATSFFRCSSSRRGASIASSRPASRIAVRARVLNAFDTGPAETQSSTHSEAESGTSPGYPIAPARRRRGVPPLAGFSPTSAPVRHRAAVSDSMMSLSVSPSVRSRS